MESFNRRLREVCLNQPVFVARDDARRQLESWRIPYNRERPHASLGSLPPVELAAATSN
jgi:putative transposase